VAGKAIPVVVYVVVAIEVAVVPVSWFPFVEYSGSVVTMTAVLSSRLEAAGVVPFILISAFGVIAAVTLSAVEELP
jgi:hypothetical protein